MGDQVGYDCEVLNDKFQKNIYDVCVMMVYVYYLYSVSMYRLITNQLHGIIASSPAQIQNSHEIFENVFR